MPPEIVHNLHHRLIDIACVSGLITTVDYEAGDVAATYKVAGWDEYWRVKSCQDEGFLAEAILEDLEEGEVFWDIGSAIGTYSILVAAAGGKSVAFEPFHTNFMRVIENAQVNNIPDRVQVESVALSDSGGMTHFETEGSLAYGESQVSASGELTIPSREGDHVDAPDPDLIKIDVEGHELAVLRGLTERLSTARIVYIEVHGKHGVTAEDVSQLLPGFEISDISNDSRGEQHLRAEKR